MRHAVSFSRLIVAYLFVLQTFFSGNGLALADEHQKKLDQFLKVAEDLRVQLHVPGLGIGIIVDGETVFADGLGYRDVENRLPVNKHTLFAIGSNTKAFTGMLVTKLVAEDKLSWDQPIATYLPNFQLSDPYVAKHVTLADACSHRTGLARRDALWKGKPLDRDLVFQQVSRLPFDFSLRSQFSYNNHMYVVVGQVIEAVTGASWEDNIRSRILIPLGMKNSFATYAEFMNYPGKSIGYDGDGRTVVPHENVDNVGPTGAISSTPGDLIAWLSVWVQAGQPTANSSYLTENECHDYLFPRSASKVGRNEFKSYWAGWGERIVDGEVQFLHSGGIDGQSSRIVARPADGFGVFVMMNQRSDFKDLLIDYAQQIFVDGDFRRDEKREASLVLSSQLSCLRGALTHGEIQRAQEIIKDLPMGDLETQMNQLGYELLAQHKTQPALVLYKLNVVEFPQSPEAWNGLGECFFRLQQYPKAIESFRQSLQLDHDNPKAAQMISHLEAILPS